MRDREKTKTGSRTSELLFLGDWGLGNLIANIDRPYLLSPQISCLIIIFATGFLFASAGCQQSDKPKPQKLHTCGEWGPTEFVNKETGDKYVLERMEIEGLEEARRSYIDSMVAAGYSEEDVDDLTLFRTLVPSSKRTGLIAYNGKNNIFYDLSENPEILKNSLPTAILEIDLVNGGPKVLRNYFFPDYRKISIFSIASGPDKGGFFLAGIPIDNQSELHFFILKSGVSFRLKGVVNFQKPVSVDWGFESDLLEFSYDTSIKPIEGFKALEDGSYLVLTRQVDLNHSPMVDEVDDLADITSIAGRVIDEFRLWKYSPITEIWQVIDTKTSNFNISSFYAMRFHFEDEWGVGLPESNYENEKYKLLNTYCPSTSSPVECERTGLGIEMFSSSGGAAAYSTLPILNGFSLLGIEKYGADEHKLSFRRTDLFKIDPIAQISDVWPRPWECYYFYPQGNIYGQRMNHLANGSIAVSMVQENRYWQVADTPEGFVPPEYSELEKCGTDESGIFIAPVSRFFQATFDVENGLEGISEVFQGNEDFLFYTSDANEVKAYYFERKIASREVWNELFIANLVETEIDVDGKLIPLKKYLNTENCNVNMGDFIETGNGEGYFFDNRYSYHLKTPNYAFKLTKVKAGDK